ncbi:MAG: helix-turn-helix domain-containing protein [Firmicutes bacterium]|nr:helix-turn-helix domain-containing protein [Bacillota bacterium]
MNGSELLRKWRLDRGLTQAQLAKAAGVTDNAISQYERGIKTPRIAVCIRLSKALGLHPDVLLNAFHGVSLPDSPAARVAR